jgi:hypothetical protein
LFYCYYHHPEIDKLDDLGLQRRRKHLYQLIGLVLVLDDQRDELAGRPGLELGHSGGLVALDLDVANVLAVDDLQELLDVCDLLRLQ